jgi:bifunctional DNA-binding transcriptional regulator/antitoxin component of YhaV-PrlF toxin-antitoxin module
MAAVTCNVDNQRRETLPANWRKRFNVSPSTEVLVTESDIGALIVGTKEQGPRRAQRIVARYVKPGDACMVDELLRDRRQEAESE